MDIREIAKLARVSTATVSRVLNGVPTVNPKLAKRVLDAADQRGYVPNTQARALVSGKSRTFGLVVSEITNPFFPQIVETFGNLAVANGYEMLLASTGNDLKRMELAVRRMIERRVDGVAILTFGMEDSLLADLRVRKVPLVGVVVGPTVPGVTNIRIDYRNGIRQAVQHLAALRHQRIAFVTGPLRLMSAMARKTAFEESMREIGLEAPPEFLVEGDHTVEGGVAALGRLVRLAKRPTAILCSNDMTAIGVIREAYELQINVPNQLSVVGFDDIHLAQFVTPPLTTVQMSQSELATFAFQALLAARERPAQARQSNECVLVTSLVLRKSTALVLGAQPIPRPADFII